jgi:hypothetical protein
LIAAVIRGRSAARLAYGLAMLPAAVIAADDATLVKNRRRVSDATPCAMTAIGASAVKSPRRKLPASSDRHSTF